MHTIRPHFCLGYKGRFDLYLRRKLTFVCLVYTLYELRSQFAKLPETECKILGFGIQFKTNIKHLYKAIKQFSYSIKGLMNYLPVGRAKFGDDEIF